MLTRWRENGDKLIVCLDANENIYKKSIRKALTDANGLALVEVVGKFTGQPVGPTYFRGSTPIDGIWASSDVTVAGACIMPAGYGIGDHRLFVVDFLTSSITGAIPHKIVRPKARRLHTTIPRAEGAYNTRLEYLFRKHRIVERMGAVHETAQSAEEAKDRLDVIDKETRDYMLHSEKKCRRIKSGRIPFSPDAAIWIRRCQVY
jgi:hypothetical protein